MDNQALMEFLRMMMPQEDFEKRLKELGIKEEHIPTLKNMVGYGKVAETKKEEDSINNS